MNRVRLWIGLLWVVLGGGDAIRAQMNVDRLIANGEFAMYYKDYFIAIQYFTQAQKAKPYRYEPYKERAIAKLYLDDFVGADADATSSIEINPFISQSYVVRGYARLGLHQYEDALQDFDRAKTVGGATKSIEMARAGVLERIGDSPKAMEIYDSLYRIGFDEAGLYYGRIAVERGDTLTAEGRLKEYIKRFPYKKEGYELLGYLYYQQQNYTAAKEQINQAIRIGEEAQDYLLRGVCESADGDLRGAMSDFNKAIQKNPNDFWGYYNRGILRTQVGEFNAAISDFEMVVNFAPENVWARMNLAELYMQIKDYTKALTIAEKIVDEHPRYAQGYYLRAEIRRKMGLKKAAFLDLQTAMYLETLKDSEQKDQDVIPKGDYKKNVVNIATGQERFLRYDADLRGDIQNKSIVIEPYGMYEIGCYGTDNRDGRIIWYNREIEVLNEQAWTRIPLRIVRMEERVDTLTIRLMQEEIGRITHKMAECKKEVLYQGYFVRAILYAMMQDYENALQDVGKSIDLNEDFALAHLSRAIYRGRTLLYRKDTEGGSIEEEHVQQNLIGKDWDVAIKETENNAYVYFDYGCYMLEMQQYERALECFAEAIRKHPNMGAAYYNRALIYLYQGKIQDAIRDLTHAGENGIPEAYNVMKRYMENGN